MPRGQPPLWSAYLEKSEKKGKILMGLEQGRSRHLLQKC